MVYGTRSSATCGVLEQRVLAGSSHALACDRVVTEKVLKKYNDEFINLK